MKEDGLGVGFRVCATWEGLIAQDLEVHSGESSSIGTVSEVTEGGDRSDSRFQRIPLAAVWRVARRGTRVGLGDPGDICVSKDKGGGPVQRPRAWAWHPPLSMFLDPLSLLPCLGSEGGSNTLTVLLWK